MFWDLPTTANRDDLIEATYVASELYRKSLIRQFIEEESHDEILRPSSLGKPAVHLFARKFFPELFTSPSDGVNAQRAQLFHEGDTFEADGYFHFVRTGIRVVAVHPKIDYRGIKGTGDIVIQMGDDTYLADFKSVNASYYNKVAPSKRNPLGAFTDERGTITQVAIYGAALNLTASVILYCRDDCRMMFVVPSEDEVKTALTRVDTIIDLWDTIDTWDDVFRYFRPPIPKAEVRKNQSTGRYGGTGRFFVPQSMLYSPAADLVYDIMNDVNEKGEPRAYVIDYKYPEKYAHLKPELK